MEHKKKTIITIETCQRTVLSRRRTPVAYCEHCAAMVEMLSPAQAAISVRENQRAIFRRIESGDLHFAETSEGRILICGVSLLAQNHQPEQLKKPG